MWSRFCSLSNVWSLESQVGHIGRILVSYLVCLAIFAKDSDAKVSRGCAEWAGKLWDPGLIKDRAQRFKLSVICRSCF